MAVPKPSDVPRWADGGTDTPTNVVNPPEHSSSIPAWAAGAFAVGNPVVRSGNEYVVTAIAGTGTSTTGPTGTGTTVDNPGANQVTWQFVTATPVTKDSGWLPNVQPPAQFFNWLFFIIYQWILWIQDIANQDFNGSGSPQNGPWTGSHQFTGGQSIGGAAIAVNAGASSGGGTIYGIWSVGSNSGTIGVHPGVGLRGDGGINSLDPADGADGVEGNGGGSGNGGKFRGGTSGTTSGGDGVNSTGGPSGRGATLQGGTVPSGGGSAGTGARCTGGPGATGLEAIGGAGDCNGAQCEGTGNGIGAVCISTGTGAALACAAFGSGPAAQFVANGTGGTAVKIQDGPIVFAGTQTTTPPANGMTAGQIPKVKTILGVFGGAVASLNDSNLDPAHPPSIIALTNEIEITFLVPFATANYGYTWGLLDSAPLHVVTANTGFNTTHKMRIQLWKISVGSITVENLATWAGQITIMVWGDQ